MPATPIDVNAELCFVTARMMLDDQNVQLWQDNILMPMMYQAHLELQQFLKSRASPVMKGYDYLTLPHYQTQFPANIGDLTSPIFLWERPSGSSVDFSPMTETDVLPLTPPINSVLTYWMWFQNQIIFTGANIDTDVIVFYWRRVPVPTQPSDLIGIIDGEQYLSPRIAALAAGSVGEEATSSVANALAQSQLQVVLASNRTRAPQLAGSSVHP